MVDELLDLVDKNDNVIGTVWKSEAHKDPKLIHREIAFVVFNKNGQVLLQQRSELKTNDPLGWELTAAGHVGVGEDPKVAAARELKEELGFACDPIFYNKVLISQGEYGESRFFYIYYAIVEKAPKIVLDKKEVAKVRWIGIGELTEFSKTHNYNLNGLSHKTIMDIAKELKII